MNDTGHLLECCNALDGPQSVPACSFGGFKCALSCLLTWRQHVQICKRCLAHVERKNICCDVHCERIRLFYFLCTEFANLIGEYKLTVDGSVLRTLMERIQTMLRMDAVNMSYHCSDKRPTWVQQQTKFVFRTLRLLFDTREKYKYLDMQLDNLDLENLLENCLAHLSSSQKQDTKI